MKITNINPSLLLITLMNSINMDRIVFSMEDIENSNQGLSLLASCDETSITVEIITRDQELILQHTNSADSAGLPN